MEMEEKVYNLNHSNLMKRVSKEDLLEMKKSEFCSGGFKLLCEIVIERRAARNA